MFPCAQQDEPAVFTFPPQVWSQLDAVLVAVERKFSALGGRTEPSGHVRHEAVPVLLHVLYDAWAQEPAGKVLRLCGPESVPSGAASSGLGTFAETLRARSRSGDSFCCRRLDGRES